MWISIVLYTLGSAAAAVWLHRYWSHNGTGTEKRVFMGWMLVAWITGCLFMAGVSLPVPYKPLFPNWHG